MLTIKRGEIDLIEVSIDDKTTYSKKLMGEHKVSTDFITAEPVSFQIGDFIEWRAEQFYLNRLPDVEETNLKTFKYKAEFEGDIYKLLNKLMMWDGLVDFSYTGTAAEFIALVVNNLNSTQSGWSAGDIDTTKEKTIYFNGESVRAALTRIAETFGLEFGISLKQISLKKTIGQVTAHIFEYGKSKGLYKLTLKQSSDQNIVTKVYGFGSTKNIPYDYRDRAKRLVFESRFLEKNIDLYGEIEAPFTDDNIYPSFAGLVTNVNITFADPDANPPVRQLFYIEASAINFDINDHLIEGEVAKIVFNSGDLTGYEFEITKYDHTLKRIYFNPFSEQDGYTLPNALNQPQIEDEFTLVNIKMPQAYIDDAEAELLAATQEYIDQNSVPQVIYELELDPKYIKGHSIILDVGDMVTIKDTKLGIDKLIRMTELSCPLVNPNKIKAIISDFVPYTTQERIIKTTREQKKEVSFVERRAAETARQNTAMLNMFKKYLIDQDGYFDPATIRPRSIETLSLTVGAIASNFLLSGDKFLENYTNDPAKFHADPCSLSHLEIEIAGLGYTWAIGSAGDFPGLNASSVYYLYAKCSKTQLTGSWELSTEVLASDGSDGFYHFLTGTLSPVDAVTLIRKFKTSYGKTYINANEIVTGIIKDIANQFYLNLINGSVKLGGFDVNVSAANTTTLQNAVLKGTLIQNPAGVVSALGFPRGVYSGSTVYYLNDLVTYNGSTWRMKYSSPIAGQAPAENAFWTIYAAKGSDGQDGSDGSDGSNGLNGSDGNFIEYQYAKNGSTTQAPAIVVTDFNPAGWSKTPPTIGAVEYLWLTKAKKPAAGTFLLENWSAPVRITGLNGVNAFTYIAYASDAAGSGFSLSPSEALKYRAEIHPAAALNPPTLSDFSGATWVKYIGDDGDDGVDGHDGDKGASLVGRGDYSSGATYYGNAWRVDAVKYNGSWYVTRSDAGTFSNQLPTNTTYWNAFGAQFESIATGLLLAELAYINNLGVKYLQTATTGQRIYINGADGSLRFYDSANTEIMSLANGVLTASKATIKSGVLGQRIEIDSATNTFKFFNSSNVNTVLINDGSGLMSGGAVVAQNGASQSIIGSTGMEYHTSTGQHFIASASGVSARVLILSASQTASGTGCLYVNSQGKLIWRDFSNNDNEIAFI